jgi:hypothetical protein
MAKKRKPARKIIPYSEADNPSNGWEAPEVVRKPRKPRKPRTFGKDRYLVCAASNGIVGYRPIRYCDTVGAARSQIRYLVRYDRQHGLTPVAYFIRDLIGRVDIPAVPGVVARKPKCRCRLPRRHRDCSFCGVTTFYGGTHVCGVCRANGIDGKLIPGTGRVVCALHRD